MEWVTPKENAGHKVFPNRANKTSSRRVVQKTLDGEVVRVWNSIRLASNTLEIDGSCISECCSKKQNTAGGWCWTYYEDYIERNSNEEWREIELNSRKFRVSSLGGVQFPNGLISQGSLSAGYLRIAREKHCVHHLVPLEFCPKEEGKEYVNHVDGNSTNNRASNLEWVNRKENNQHATRLGFRYQCAVR